MVQSTEGVFEIVSLWFIPHMINADWGNTTLANLYTLNNIYKHFSNSKFSSNLLPVNIFPLVLSVICFSFIHFSNF